MWRLWDMDSHKEQEDSYSVAIDGIPVMAKDSDESVMRLPPWPCILFQAQAVTHYHPLVSL